MTYPHTEVRDESLRSGATPSCAWGTIRSGHSVLYHTPPRRWFSYRWHIQTFSTDRDIAGTVSFWRQQSAIDWLIQHTGTQHRGVGCTCDISDALPF